MLGRCPNYRKTSLFQNSINLKVIEIPYDKCIIIRFHSVYKIPFFQSVKIVLLNAIIILHPFYLIEMTPAEWTKLIVDEKNSDDQSTYWQVE